MSDHPRLSTASLSLIPPDVVVPTYDRAAVRRGVVHLGIGAFHRAHQAVVFDDAIASGDTRWGVVGASLRSAGVRDQLGPQDGLYGLHIRDGDHDRVRIIAAIQDVLVGPDKPTALVAQMAAPDTHLVTLTVTEKGYCLDPTSGALIESDPEVAADLVSLDRPRTAPGFLTAALARRRAEGRGPLSVVSCDNLPHNGVRLRNAVLAMAARHDAALHDWIAETCTFPATMVDRIVPATTAADIDAAAARLGVRDEGLVLTEPFSQWVIEDRFAGARPDFEAFGVRLTDSVAPWEDAKLRLLNGAHSAIAYLGGLAGLEFVHQVVAEAAFAAFIERLWDEAQTTLDPPPGLDLAAYRRDLMARFANPALNHRTRQIAMDGSQKLPQRLLAGCAIRLDRGQPIDALALTVAAWMHWQEGRDDAGQTFVVDDPLASTTARLVAANSDPAERARALMSLRAVFPARLAEDAGFVEPVVSAHRTLGERGARGAVEALVGRSQ